MLEYIISGCKIMAKEEYLQKHNNVAKVVHQTQLRKEKNTKF
jgi:hypothetical protein